MQSNCDTFASQRKARIFLLEKSDGSEVEYRIVGPDEIESDSSKGYISVDSPMARALLKKEVDDEVRFSPGGVEQIFFVNRIRYE